MKTLCEGERDERTLSHHNPEHHGDFLLEIFLLAKPQSAALEATEEQQKEELIQECQPVWREANNDGRTESKVETYQNYEHRNIL